MRIISFLWTKEKVLAGKKTVTRRIWKKCSIRPGDVVSAYDKSPRFGGKHIAFLKILQVNMVRVDEISDADAKREGFKHRDDFLFFWLKKYPGTRYDLVWRIEFKVIPEGDF